MTSSLLVLSPDMDLQYFKVAKRKMSCAFCNETIVFKKWEEHLFVLVKILIRIELSF